MSFTLFFEVYLNNENNTNITNNIAIKQIFNCILSFLKIVLQKSEIIK